MSPSVECPTCGLSNDSLRARVVKVRGAKVVAYCSEECARGVAPERPPERGTASLPVVAMARETSPAVPVPTIPHGSLPALVVPVDAEPEWTPVPTPDRPQTIVRPLSEVVARAASPRVPKARKIVALAVLAFVLAGLAILQSWSSARSAPAEAAASALPAAPTEVAASIVIPTAPSPDNAEARPDSTVLAAESRTLLGRYLGDSSPRLRLLAAFALARTQDPAALAELRQARAKEPSEIRRVEIAFALARAFDADGKEHLARGLGHVRRDVRLQAARLLARLGDARGKERLKEALGQPTQRLGAAETLAVLGDGAAILALKESLARGGQEMRMRAAVGLGRAGDGSGIELLREMVAERRVELGAADALARLGDPSSVPALTRALELTAMRVDAALTLRCLGAEVDFRPLARVLAGGDDLGQISAAEAILVLVDPNVLVEPTECRK